eukprot:2859910-Pleurochrysis_carterae.AAC.1
MACVLSTIVLTKCAVLIWYPNAALSMLRCVHVLQCFLVNHLLSTVCEHVLQRRNPLASWLQYMRKDNVDGDDVMALGLALIFDISVRVIRRSRDEHGARGWAREQVLPGCSTGSQRGSCSEAV